MIEMKQKMPAAANDQNQFFSELIKKATSEKIQRIAQNQVDKIVASQALVEPVSEAKMQKLHNENSMVSKNQCKTAKEFLSQVMYDVELFKLYEVMASSQYTEDSEFCPVMVKINNEDIIAENSGLQYLLQVWSIRGELVFEKPLDKPVTSWNVSRNKLLFQEDDNNPNLVYLVKLFIDKLPVVFKFYLPEDRRVRPQELGT